MLIKILHTELKIMTAYLIAGIELNKVYRKETGLVRVTKFDKESNTYSEEKNVTKYFIGNIEITEFVEGIVSGTKNKPNINYKKVNQYFLSNGIILTLDFYYLGICIEDTVELTLDLIKESLNNAKVDFKKLGIDETPILFLTHD